MPLRVIHYSTNAELPESVRAQLPDDVAQSIFRAALNSHLSGGRTEMHAYVKAWRVLSDVGYTKSGNGAWVYKDAPAVADVHVDRPLGAVRPRRQGTAQEDEEKEKDDPGTQDVAPPEEDDLETALPRKRKKDEEKDDPGTQDIAPPALEGGVASPLVGASRIAKRISGNSPIHLNTKGKQLAEQLGKRIAARGGLDVLHSSPLNRAKETADAIAGHNSEAERAAPSDALRPWRLGDIEGRETSDVKDLIAHYIEHPEEVPPGKGNDGKPAESFNSAKRRQLDFLSKIKQDADDHPTTKIGVVMHSRGMELLRSWVDAGCPEDYDLEVKDVLNPDDPDHNTMLRWGRKNKIKEVDLDDDEELRPGVYLILHGLTDDDTDEGNEEELEKRAITKFLPPLEVNRACRVARDLGCAADSITEPLAAGEGVGVEEVRKILEYWQSAEHHDDPPVTRNAWGGPHAERWCERVIKRIEKADEEGQWVTIRGQHVLIDSKGNVLAGNPKLGNQAARAAGVAEFHPSERMQRAMKAYVAANAQEQRAADAQEVTLSRALGLPRTKDNLAFDLSNGKVAVELKTMMKSAAGKITMSKSALARKNEEIRSTRVKAYTVVADRRSGATQYYYAKGVGSFRVSSMTRATLGDLKELLR